MFKELDLIALTGHIPFERIFDVPQGSPLRKDDDQREGLRPGDVGTIVHVHPGGEAFMVEFLEPDGYTVAIAGVLAAQARPATDEDIANDRFWQKSPAR